MTDNMRRGFTLLELSVVLIIISLITGLAISSGVAVVSSARQSSTQAKMNAIEDALMAYRVANDRIPCPGDLGINSVSANYGVEAANPGSCTGGTPAATYQRTGQTNVNTVAYEGSLPAVTLGLPIDFMVDGWGNQFRYIVDTRMTSLGAFVGMPIGCVDAAVTVTDVNGNSRTTGAIYALLSHGANGHGAFTRNAKIVNSGSANANELVNCHCSSAGVANSGAQNASYVQMAPYVDSTHSTGTNNFDDLVTFKERWQMQTPWDTPGACLYIYIADTGNDRVEQFDLNGNYVAIPTTSGTGNGQIQHPLGLALDTNGNFWVAEAYNNRVEEFDSNWNWKAALGGTSSACTACLCTAGSCPVSSGNGNGQFNQPSMIAFDKNGNMWVVDHQNNRVEEFDKNGNYLSQFGSSGTGSGQFPSYPQWIAIDKSGNIWVTSKGSTNSLQEFSSSGAFIANIGSGNFLVGLALQVDISGNIWATNGCTSPSNPIQEYQPNGTLIAEYGVGGNNLGKFGCAAGISFDLLGNAYITDSGASKFQIMTPAGTFTARDGVTGSGNGQMQSPTGVVVTFR